MLQGDSRTVAKSRDLRRNMTLPEVLLWQQLRLRPGGFRFRKQHPATPYVLDFYCHEARLIVEVDGIAHDMGDMPQRNQMRDAHFKSKGLRVVRIRAADVLRDPAGTAESLVAICLSPLSPSATGGSYTSPRGGDSSGTAP